MYDTSPTLIEKILADRERSKAWLARKLRVSRQSVGAWVRAEEACPLSRQAQIAVILSEDDPALTASYRAVELFDRHGFAITTK